MSALCRFFRPSLVGKSVAAPAVSKPLFSTQAKTQKQIPEFNAELVVKSNNMLGECVLWDDVKNEVAWIDNFGKKFCTFCPHSKQFTEIALPEKPGSFALLNQNLRSKFGDNAYLIAFENGPAFYDIEKSLLIERVFTFEPRAKLATQMNDGRVDNQGRFVVGGMNVHTLETIPEAAANPSSNVYRICADGKSYQVLYENIACTNSICFSVDGKSMFLTDCFGWTEKHIRRIEYFADDRLPNITGDLSQNDASCRVFARMDGDGDGDGDGFFDGSVIDASDCLWNAQPLRSRVARYDTHGELDMVVNVAEPFPTCATFGGPDMDTLYVVCLDAYKVGGDEERKKEINGGLYSCKMPVKGRLENRFGH